MKVIILTTLYSLAALGVVLQTATRQIGDDYNDVSMIAFLIS